MIISTGKPRIRRADELISLVKSKLFWFGIFLLVLGIAVNSLASFYLIQKYHNNLPVLDDLLLRSLPYCNSCIWLYDLLNLIPMFLFVVYCLIKKTKEIPYILVLFGIWETLRGVFIVLTPFGSPNAFAAGILKGAAFLEGLYPSGHTGSVFLAFLLAKGNYKRVIGIFTIAVVVTLLLGRGHYSIDIFSAILFAYAIYAFGEHYLKKRICSA